METQEKIGTKLPKAFLVQLFILFVFVVWGIVRCLFSLPKFFTSDFSMVVALSAAFYIMFYLYTWCGIYRALQLQSRSIVMLKISLIFIAVEMVSYFWGEWNPFYGPIHGLGGIVLLYFLVFFLYLQYSKTLQQLIAKKDRHFGRPGWLGLLLIVLFIGVGAVPEVVNHLSVPKMVGRPVLAAGEMSDGYSKFHPLEGWCLDSVYEDAQSKALRFSVGHQQYIDISSLPAACKNRNEYHQLVAQLYHLSFAEQNTLEEIAHKDTVIHGNRCYSTTYQIDTAGVWTLAVLISDSYKKTLIFSSMKRGTEDWEQNTPFAFFETVDFQLEDAPIME